VNKTLKIYLILICIIFTLQNTLYALALDPGEKANKISIQKAESQKTVSPDEQAQFPVKFSEVWGYLMRGEEKVFRGDEPVTDLCYFSCEPDSNGRINTKVVPPKLNEINGMKRRIHMVISDLDNYRNMRRILDPGKEARQLLVNDIIEVSKKFDGVQIDFESVSDDDSANFLEFLRIVKAGLGPSKIFSIALPAKIYKVKDAYDYRAISKIADKVFIMAYDQHWSTSKPGPVASLPWCRSIMNYAKSEIPPDKLIMGIPLYGRSWKEVKIVKKIKARTSYAKKGKKSKKKRTITVTKRVTKSNSVRTANISSLLKAKNCVKEYSPESGFRIKSIGSSKQVLYCDDINATMEKFRYYREFVDSVGFWRLGMESPEMWKEITVKND